MNEHKNIHEAINAVMEEVGYVKKSRSAGVNYSFAGESALIAALRPSMVEHGIYMHVAKIESIARENITTKSGTPMVNTLIHATVKFTHSPSGTSIESAATGEGFDSGDKSANKAMTGLYKYAMRQTFCIETGDDPDKYAIDEKPKPAPVRNDQKPKSGGVDQSPERTEAVKAFSASFNAIPQNRKGEAKTVTGKSTIEEIKEATAYNLKLMENK